MAAMGFAALPMYSKTFMAPCQLWKVSSKSTVAASSRASLLSMSLASFVFSISSPRTDVTIASWFAAAKRASAHSPGKVTY